MSEAVKFALKLADYLKKKGYNLGTISYLIKSLGITQGDYRIVFFSSKLIGAEIGWKDKIKGKEIDIEGIDPKEIERYIEKRLKEILFPNYYAEKINLFEEIRKSVKNADIPKEYFKSLEERLENVFIPFYTIRNSFTNKQVCTLLYNVVNVNGSEESLKLMEKIGRGLFNAREGEISLDMTDKYFKNFLRKFKTDEEMP